MLPPTLKVSNERFANFLSHPYSARMDPIVFLVDFVLHIDAHLTALIASFGLWTYVIVFLIIVGETGLVIAPILPGDSLLFAAGALAAKGVLNIWVLVPLFWLAAVAGDSLNYTIGKHFGVRAFRTQSRFLNHDHLEQAKEFFRRHGGKSIVLARFLPFVRTFAPFVAGISHMHYGKFLFYNVIGGAIWVSTFTIGGYFFGQIPAVQENFSVLILGIIAISVLPSAVAWLKVRLSKKA